MEAFLNGSSQDAPSLASGIADKLKLASTEAGDFAPSSRSNFTLATETRLLAEEAALSRIEMGRLAAWLHDAYTPEASQLFTVGIAEGLAYSQPVNVHGTMGGGRPAARGGPPHGGRSSGGSPSAGGNGPSRPGDSPPRLPQSADEGRHYDGTFTTEVDSAQAEKDCEAHQLSGAQIIRLTWLLHTARKPPPEHDELVYGVDPANMPKLYKSYKSASGSMLWDLANSDKTSMAQLRDHMHRAQQSAKMLDPRFATRISDHWGEMQQYFGDSVSMIRAYYRKYLQLYAGRGLPVLVDKDILVLILCSAFQSGSTGEDDKKLEDLVEKQSKSVEALKDQVSELKSALGSFKEDLKQVKEQVKELKTPKKFCNWCKQKGFPAVGHTEGECTKKKAAAASDE